MKHPRNVIVIKDCWKFHIKLNISLTIVDQDMFQHRRDDANLSVPALSYNSPLDMMVSM